MAARKSSRDGSKPLRTASKSQPARRQVVAEPVEGGGEGGHGDDAGHGHDAGHEGGAGRGSGPGPDRGQGRLAPEPGPQGQGAGDGPDGLELRSGPAARLGRPVNAAADDHHQDPGAMSPTRTTRSRWVPTEGSTVRAKPVGTRGVPSQGDAERHQGAQGDHGEGEEHAQRRPLPGAHAQLDQDRDLGQGRVEQAGEGLHRGGEGGHPGDQAEHPEGDGLDGQRALHGDRFVVPGERGHRSYPAAALAAALNASRSSAPWVRRAMQRARARRDAVGVGLEERRSRAAWQALPVVGPDVEDAPDDADHRRLAEGLRVLEPRIQNHPSVRPRDRRRRPSPR